MENLNVTADAWAAILIERWQKEIDRLEIIDSGTLYNSFEHVVHAEANGDIQKIELAYEFYGWFVDLGVGRGTKLEDVSEQALLGSRTRKPRKWIGKVLSRETFKLAEIMKNKYADQAVGVLVHNVPGKLVLG